MFENFISLFHKAYDAYLKYKCWFLYIPVILHLRKLAITSTWPSLTIGYELRVYKDYA